MKHIALTLSVLLMSHSAFAAQQPRTFTIENRVVIDANIDTVFDFAANPENDTQWRSEVNTMTAYGPWEVGTVYLENSHLGRNPHFITPTVLTELVAPHRMVVLTPEDNLYLRATRTFEELKDGRTRMTYRLEIDVRMPAAATGLSLPLFLVEAYYNQVMRTYLWQLRNLLEED